MINWKEKASVEFPEGVDVKLEGANLTIDGPKGSIIRKYIYNYVRIQLDGRTVKIQASKENRKTLAIVSTWESLIRKSIEGVTHGYTYEMKIDYSHYPMRVMVRGNEVVIENFLGERSSRRAKIVGNSKVTVKGDRVIIEGVDKQQLGDTAANIERATKIKGFDPRVFQDGVFIIGGKLNE